MDNFDIFEKPEDTEKRSADIKVVALFFLSLSEHFGLPLDVRGWSNEIGLLADFLRECSESNKPDIMKVFSEFYRVVLKNKLSRYFRAEVGKLTTVN